MAVLLKFGEEKLLEGEYMILQPNVSEEVFWEYVNEDSNCELINGVLIIHSPASKEHEKIFGYLYSLFHFYLEKNNEGQVFGSRFVMRLSEKWNPEPDLFVVLPKNYSNIKDTYYDGAADLVIEILSPSTRELDLEKKLPKFLEAGVKEIWVIDPEERSLILHHKSDQKKYEDAEAEEIIKSTVIPGFKFRIKWLWNREQYPAFKTFQEL